MRSSAWLGLFLLSACGDPLVNGEYRGDVLTRISGTVLIDQGFYWPDESLRVAVFWATEGGGLGTEQQVVATTSFPAQYELELYQPPPANALFRPEWADVDIAVATPMLYEDRDGDGVWGSGDPFVGGSPDVALVWSTQTEQTIELDGEDWFVDLQPGFQQMWAHRPYCDEEPGVTYFPADSDPVDLYVGPYWDWFADWDCDDSFSEWEDLCPPPDEVEELLQQDLPPEELEWLLLCTEDGGFASAADR